MRPSGDSRGRAVIQAEVVDAVLAGLLGGGCRARGAEVSNWTGHGSSEGRRGREEQGERWRSPDVTGKMQRSPMRSRLGTVAPTVRPQLFAQLSGAGLGSSGLGWAASASLWASCPFQLIVASNKSLYAVLFPLLEPPPRSAAVSVIYELLKNLSLPFAHLGICFYERAWG